MEASESGSESENAPVLLSVAWLAAVLQRKQRDVQLKTPVQVTFMSFMLSGFTGFFVLRVWGDRCVSDKGHREVVCVTFKVVQ